MPEVIVSCNFACLHTPYLRLLTYETARRRVLSFLGVDFSKRIFGAFKCAVKPKTESNEQFSFIDSAKVHVPLRLQNLRTRKDKEVHIIIYIFDSTFFAGI